MKNFPKNPLSTSTGEMFGDLDDLYSTERGKLYEKK
jgi:hypothetical protein